MRFLLVILSMFFFIKDYAQELFVSHGFGPTLTVVTEDYYQGGNKSYLASKTAPGITFATSNMLFQVGYRSYLKQLWNGRFYTDVLVQFEEHGFYFNSNILHEYDNSSIRAIRSHRIVPKRYHYFLKKKGVALGLGYSFNLPKNFKLNTSLYYVNSVLEYSPDYFQFTYDYTDIHTGHYYENIKTVVRVDSDILPKGKSHYASLHNVGAKVELSYRFKKLLNIGVGGYLSVNTYDEQLYAFREKYEVYEPIQEAFISKDLREYFYVKFVSLNAGLTLNYKFN